MVGPNKHIAIYTYTLVCSAVMLVWGSLRLAPITLYTQCGAQSDSPNYSLPPKFCFHSTSASNCDQGESTTTAMEIDTHEQQEPEHQHMDKNTTLSLVSKLLNPMSSGITVPDQGMGTGIPCLPPPE